MVSYIFTWSIGLKKGFEKTLSKFWPKLDLWVLAKSGKVNFEKRDYNRSR